MTAYSVPSRAVEPIEPNTKLVTPKGETLIIAQQGYLLSERELEAAILWNTEMESCQQALEICRKRTSHVPPKPTFWQSKTGKKLKFGGFVVTVSGALVLGTWIGTKLQ